MVCTDCWILGDNVTCVSCGATSQDKLNFINTYNRKYYGGRFDVKQQKGHITSYDLSTAYPYYMNHAQPKPSLWQRFTRLFRRS